MSVTSDHLSVHHRCADITCVELLFFVVFVPSSNFSLDKEAVVWYTVTVEPLLQVVIVTCKLLSLQTAHCETSPRLMQPKGGEREMWVLQTSRDFIFAKSLITLVRARLSVYRQRIYSWLCRDHALAVCTTTLYLQRQSRHTKKSMVTDVCPLNFCALFQPNNYFTDFCVLMNFHCSS